MRHPPTFPGMVPGAVGGLVNPKRNMCGICGIVTSGRIGQPERNAVLGMSSALQRRGPDGEGTFFSDHVALGMRRLAIIDLQGGWQPLYNEDQSIALVANGEIYNYIELREQLIGLGHKPRTKSDCELPAHLYEQYGFDFVDHLRGMFAIAMWDARNKRLILVRDRMGEKPLYIHERTLPGGVKQIIFASEMKGLISSGQVPFEIDPQRVDEVFHYGWVHDPHTAVKGVRKLPAGHMLIIDVEPWSVREVCYWRMEDAPPLEGDPAQLIREQLERISELVIRADVPVGVTLSGGVDSSTIACLAASKYPGLMHAFSIGWVGRPVHDERDKAMALAKKLNMPFHEAEVHPAEMASFFPEICLLQDDPIADITGYAYYLVNKLARENDCPVLLMGQGGDELFWGYAWARRALQETMFKLKHGRVRNPGVRELMLPREFSRSGLVEYAFRLGAMIHGWRRMKLPGSNDKKRLVFYDLVDHWQMGEWARGYIYTDAFREKINGFDAAWPFICKTGCDNPEIALTALLCKGYLLENGINHGDRLSMANSVECRLPLVDYRLVETVIGLRKTHSGDAELGTKAWLRMAVEDIVPAEIFDRPKKGFNPPVTQWTESLRDRYGRDLREGYLVQTGVLSPEAAESMTETNSRLTPWNDLFFKALTLEMWARGISGLAARAAGAGGRVRHVA